MTAKPDTGSGARRGEGVEALFSASSSLPSARANTTKLPPRERTEQRLGRGDRESPRPRLRLPQNF